MATNHDDPAGDATRPLMAAEPDTIETSTSQRSSPPSHSALSFRNTSTTVRFLTLSAGLSGLLFGFDTGVISATLVALGADLSGRELSTADKSLITGVTAVLALLAAPWTGYCADRFGRKSVLRVPALLFVLGAALQAAATTVSLMVVGRALVGAAVGVASGASPLYITELAPAELRGRLVTIQSLFVTGGQVVAYLVGEAFASVPHGWRYMVGVGAIPALLQLGLLIWMPETPRWLIRSDRPDLARHILLQIYANLPEAECDAMAQAVFDTVEAEILAENKATRRMGDEQSASSFIAAARELITIPANRRALAIACLLQGLQQLSGFNCLMYFSASIFALVGFTSPIATSLSIAVTNFLFTLVAFAFIDRIGRRSILLRSIPFMVIGLLACSVAFRALPINDDLTATATSSKAGAGAGAPFLVASMILYVAAYAVGLGCVPWQQSELFALRVRACGAGLATAVNWASNALVALTFLPMMGALGPPVTFAVYAGVCAVGWGAVWMVYPETAGLELEDVQELLREGWGVRESVVAFRERKASQRSGEGETLGGGEGS